VFNAEGIQVVLTPAQAPNANAFAERWVRTVREELLDHLPILSGAHLRSVLRDYVKFYNTRRPHQGLTAHSPPQSTSEPLQQGAIVRSDLLGGIVHDYHRAAA
jgi:putative transposase